MLVQQPLEDDWVTDESTFSLVYRLRVKVPRWGRGKRAAKGRGRGKGGVGGRNRNMYCFSYSGRGLAPFYQTPGRQVARSVVFEL